MPNRRRKTAPVGTVAVETPAIDVQPDAPQGAWYRMDLHMHTPGSQDYEQPGITCLDILQQAERRGLDMIAFTDHNTSNGYRLMMREIADLEMLERLNRIQPDELGRLLEYRRLLKKILVLPGFEFTSTFGFHILGIFPPEKSLRDIEYLLYEMHVPSEVLDKGLTEAGATSDVLTAYRLIDEAGGLAIAAHANSSSGVLMRGVNIGGQTRIAFTQDPHLAAVELTDLSKGRRSMAYWLSGIKAEYPRRMHLIQGSDAHRLTVSNADARRLGVGDRTSEVLLPERSFAALRALFLSQDFNRVRQSPAPLSLSVDPVKDIRAQNASAILAFHAALPRRSANRFEEIVNDVGAMANGDGGTILVGCEAGVTKTPKGVAAADETARKLSETLRGHITPELPLTIVVQTIDEAQVIRVTVPRTDQAPYAVDGNRFYVRNGSETRSATRDEIVAITKRSLEMAAAKLAQAAQSSQQSSQAGQPSQASQPDRHRDRGGRGQGHPQAQRLDQGQRIDPRQPQQQTAQQSSQQPSQPPQPPQPLPLPPQQPRQQQHGQPRQSQLPKQLPPQQPQQVPQQIPQQAQSQPPTAPSQPPQQPAQQQRRQAQPDRHQRQPRPQQPANYPPQQPQADAARDTGPTPAPIEKPAGSLPVKELPALPNGMTATETPAASTSPAAPVTPPVPPAPPPIEGMPRSGVQIAAVDEREGIRYYTVRDLRNNSLVRNVTIKSARDLWHYAIVAYNTNAYKIDAIPWKDASDGQKRAVLNRAFRAGKMRYDLALKTSDGTAYIFYGVAEDGMDPAWKQMIADEQSPAPLPPVAQPAGGPSDSEVTPA